MGHLHWAKAKAMWPSDGLLGYLMCYSYWLDEWSKEIFAFAFSQCKHTLVLMHTGDKYNQSCWQTFGTQILETELFLVVRERWSFCKVIVLWESIAVLAKYYWAENPCDVIEQKDAGLINFCGVWQSLPVLSSISVGRPPSIWSHAWVTSLPSFS